VLHIYIYIYITLVT